MLNITLLNCGGGGDGQLNHTEEKRQLSTLTGSQKLFCFGWACLLPTSVASVMGRILKH